MGVVVKRQACVVAAAEVLLLVWSSAILAGGGANASGPQGASSPRKGMELPPELQTNVSELKVTERKMFVWPKKPIPQMLRLDPYRVVNFKRGWTDTSGHDSLVALGKSTLEARKSESAYDYSFEVVGADGPPLVCQCVAESSSRDVAFGGEHSGVSFPSGRGRLTCLLGTAAEPGPWTLEVNVELVTGLVPKKVAQGWVRRVEDEITVEGTERQVKWGAMHGLLVGFVLRRGGQPVGAVDVVPNPAVLFGAALPPELHQVVAGIGAALLLFDDGLNAFH
jgi:hypothetical protein